MAEFYKQPDFEIDFDHGIVNSDAIHRIRWNEFLQLDNSINTECKINIFLFFQAISMVTLDYITFNEDVLNQCVEQKSKKGKKKRIIKYEKHLERTFAYELYRNWQNLLMQHKLHLRVDAEIGKKLTYDRINYIKLSQLKGERKIPDLVLHSSQGNTDNHTIICEIKRDEQLSKKKIKDDIIKICRFMDSQIWDNKPYKIGCFLLVSRNREFENFKNSIKIAKDDFAYYHPKVNFSNLFCLHYNGEVIKYNTLKEIVEL